MPPPAAPRPPSGVEFPLDSKGERSTTEVNREAFAVAVEAIDPALAKAVRQEGKWRFRYGKHLVDQVEASLRSPDAAIKVAEAGLRYLHRTMEFVRDGESLPLADAMAKYTTGTFETAVVQGVEAAPRYEARVPYQGAVLSGDELKVRVDKWTRAGVIELGCGHALTKVADSPKWLDLTDRVFVMLGASSAMGPFPTLMALGATVVAVDIDRPAIWEKLIATCRQSPGKLVFPLKRPQRECATDADLAAAAGCNLLTQTPEIRNWLLTVEVGRPVVVGAYAYLDGPLFVRVSVAMDAIVADLADQRNAGVAYLCTPTDAHVVPAAAADQSATLLRGAPLWQSLLAAALPAAHAPKPNRRKPVMAANGEQFYVCDAIVTDQGPNYILAKRLQHWRAMVVRANAAARSTTGLQAVVSSNVAPSTATLSVVSNKSFALAYQGMHHFRPVEVFQQETSSAVMALLLIHDVCNDHSAANPATPLRHPLTLFTATSFHGGAWRCAYKFGSIGAGSVLAAIATNYVTKGYLALYNGLQAVGWGAVLGQVALHALSRSAAPLWGPTLGRTVATFQWLAVLEVLHAAVGAVRSPVGTTFVQVLSRVLLVSAVQYDPVLQSRDNPFLWLMLVAWSVTEIVRYGYYAAGQWRPPPRLLTWLRYTLFLVLYPAGVAGEMGCLHRAIPGLERTPGPDAPFLVRHALHPILRWPLGYYAVVVPVYIVGLKTLYSYMLAQRRRILGDTAPKGKVKAE